MARARKNEYSELLKDPRWQRLRLEIFNRDNWTCQRCHCTHIPLAVHHKHYVAGKMPWEYEAFELITVCEECHNLEYQTRRENERLLLDAVRVAGLWSDDVERLWKAFYSIADCADVSWLTDALAWVIDTPKGMEKLLDLYDAETVNKPEAGANTPANP